MKEKVKVLFVRSKKMKHKATIKTFEDLIEIEAPDMYEFMNCYIWENIIEQVVELRPEIIFLSQNESMNILELLKTIKQVHPSVTIFAFLPNRIDNEQETIDEYMAAGAYKCMFSNFSINTLVHDMYVALNLE